MTQLEKTKTQAIDSLKSLCAKCGVREDHVCRVAGLIQEIQKLNGIPVIVNEQLRHVVFHG